MGNSLSESAGKNPMQGLVWNKEKTGLYGITKNGGDYGCGVIFLVSLSGIITIFSFSEEFGKNPFSKPVLDEQNNVLYGTTLFGGKHNYGTIYAFDLNTHTIRIVHDFDVSCAGQILSNLVIVKNKLFGCSTYGGNNKTGSIFVVNKTGSEFKILHEFSGFDGKYPICTLFLNGFTLYGSTMSGGEFDKGTIFRIYTNGLGFKVLSSFDGKNGISPIGNLVINDNALYGISILGGSFGTGTIFMINLKSLRLKATHSFTSDSGGVTLFGGLTNLNEGNVLFGMTTNGGIGESGSLYSFDIENKKFTVLHNFLGGYDGISGNGQLIFDNKGTKLFGITYSGGLNNSGVVFGYDLANNSKFTIPFFSKSCDNLYKPEIFLNMTFEQFDKLCCEKSNR